MNSAAARRNNTIAASGHLASPGVSAIVCTMAAKEKPPSRGAAIVPMLVRASAEPYLSGVTQDGPRGDRLPPRGVGPGLLASFTFTPPLQEPDLHRPARG